MVVQDDMDPHREGDRHQDGEFLPGLADLFDRSVPWRTTDPDDFEDFWESAPTFEKWRKGGKWN